MKSMMMKRGLMIWIRRFSPLTQGAQLVEGGRKFKEVRSSIKMQLELKFKT